MIATKRTATVVAFIAPLLLTIAWPRAAAAQGTCSPFSLTPVNPSSLALNGTAALSNGQLDLITQSQPSAAGTAWLPTPIPLAGGFAVQFIVQMTAGPLSLSTGDGFSVLLQDQSTTALGNAPNGGAGGLGDVGLLNTLAVEFHTALAQQPFVSVVESSSTSALGAVQPLITSTLPANVADGNPHTIDITMLPLSGPLTVAPGPSMQLTIELDGSVVLVGGAVLNGALATFPATATLNAGSVYLGFGASNSSLAVGTVNMLQLQTAVGATATSAVTGQLSPGIVLFNPATDGFVVQNPNLPSFAVTVQVASWTPNKPFPPDFFTPLIVKGVDACGNPMSYGGGDSVGATVTPIGNPPSPLLDPPQVKPTQYVGQGLYLLWVQMPVIGDWHLNVTMNGRPITNSPFTFRNRLLSSISASASVSAGTLTVTASLQQVNTTFPISGDTLQFTLPDGSSASAVTDSSGSATVTASAPTAIGTYSVSVSFAGDGFIGASTGTATFQIVVDPLAQCQSDLVAARSATQTLTTTNISLQGQLETANATVAAQQGQLATAQTTIANQGQTIASLTANNASLQSQLNAANATISTQQGQLIAAQATITSQGQTITSLQTQDALLATQVLQLQQQLTTAAATIAALQAQIASLSQTLQTAFNDPLFVIPGTTPQAQLQNLVTAIGQLNHGQQKALYTSLGGSK